MKKITFTLFVGLFVLATPSVGFGQVFRSSLSLGSKGEEVRALQSLLSQVPGVYPEAKITGYFGTLTERAVKKLQKENGLEQVGGVGPKTRLLLNSILNKDSSVTQSMYVPMINVIESSSSGTTTAYVFWTTNKNTTSDFWYSSTTPVNTLTAPKLVDSAFSMSHSHNLSGLTASTTYYYVIKVTDERLNSATSTERSLVTLPN